MLLSLGSWSEHHALKSRTAVSDSHVLHVIEDVQYPLMPSLPQRELILSVSAVKSG